MTVCERKGAPKWKECGFRQVDVEETVHRQRTNTPAITIVIPSNHEKSGAAERKLHIYDIKGYTPPIQIKSASLRPVPCGEEEGLIDVVFPCTHPQQKNVNRKFRKCRKSDSSGRVRKSNSKC